MTCFFCGGAAHPATGHAYSERVLACGPCYREHMVWLKGRLHNPIAEAAVRPFGTVIDGDWSAEDQARREASRARRRKKK